MPPNQTAARMIGNAEPQTLGEFQITLSVPTTLSRGASVVPMTFEIHPAFSLSVARLYEGKIKLGYKLTPEEITLLAGGIRNYREILKALLMTVNKVKPAKDTPTITLVQNFSRGIM